jgi:hypothetical protein
VEAQARALGVIGLLAGLTASRRESEHHRVKPYRQELIDMLRSAGVDFDEKYLD